MVRLLYHPFERHVDQHHHQQGNQPEKGSILEKPKL
jgi:hypothetical protein